MKYRAKRPCRFAGKMYLIGEIIPDGVVQEAASTRLIKMGVIEAVDVEGVTPPLPSTSVETVETDDKPIEETVEEAEAEATAEEKTEEVAEDTVEEGANQSLEFTVDNLVGLKKAELLELADSYGMDVKKLKVLNKTEIAEAVLEVVKDDI